MNAEVSYEILSGNDGNVFTIDNQTGIISVVNSTLIDFETRRQYKLIIQAKDKGLVLLRCVSELI